MRRIRTQSRLLCLLTALLMIAPGVSLASLMACQCEASVVSAVDGSSSSGGCCSVPVERDAPAPEQEPAGSDEGGCDDCDCPAMCCSSVKAPAGVTSVPTGLPSVHVLSFFEVGTDRDEGVGAVFEIAHPPKL